jgi:hypothetical protein
MAGVFQNIDSPPPSPPSEYPRLWCGGRTHSMGGEGGGGSIFLKTPGTALYSTYVSTLWEALTLVEWLEGALCCGAVHYLIAVE